ncbi:MULTISPECIES: LPS export ABC transporter permease LptG [Marinomonas]|uniref:LPS export ABC transporter permease LptG n=1 Tax=Marinomonas TaxID=28253 RepID=UPI0010567A9F|nr:LPS export ABC transporter permease LptG [Marinomonas sp. KMM3893]
MNKIDRYVATSVLWSFLVVMFVLLGLDTAIAFIDQIKKVSDDYTVQSILQVLLYRLPGKFAEYVPISSLIGTLMGLGTLASTSELTVMRAAGMPIWRIGLSACQPIIFVALFGMGLSEFVAPVAEQKANLVEKLQDQKEGNFALTGGVWLKADNNFVYINAADRSGKLYGIKIFSPDGQHLKSITDAKSAIHINDTQWLLADVKKTVFYPDHIKVQTLPSEKWSVSIKPEHLYLASQEPDFLSLSQLRTYQLYLETQKQDGAQYALEFWSKALRPIACIALVLVALSSVFGPLRSSTMGGRIFSGVMIGLAFQNGLNLFGRMSVATGFPPAVGVSIPIVICLLSGILLMRRRG